MPSELISIIVPIYNTESYLRKCIDSILSQTYKNIELILVDDGSDDKCPEICDEYAKKDKRVIVIHQDNAGVSVARNVGLDNAKGEYIGFVDCDDWIEPDMYEVLYDIINLSKTSIAISYDCYNDYVPKKANLDEYITLSGREALIGLLNNKFDFCAVWAKLFSKKSIENIRFSTDITLAEDKLFMIQAFINCEKVSFINYQSYHYIIRLNSASHLYKESIWTFLIGSCMGIDLIKEYDVSLSEIVDEYGVIDSILIAKKVEELGKFTKENYLKIVSHIRKFLNINMWKLMPFNEKCWACLLLLGRTPFIMGRKLRKMILDK